MECEICGNDNYVRCLCNECTVIFCINSCGSTCVRDRKEPVVCPKCGKEGKE